jgi:hypothetical protein
VQIRISWHSRFVALFTLLGIVSVPVTAETNFSDPGLITDFRSGEYKDYLSKIKTQIYRNLKVKSIPKDVSIRFFLTEKGMVRDITVIKSSGDISTDSHCVDAAYCASPLPAPPYSRTVVRPPSLPITPDDFGEGVCIFSFEKTSKEPSRSEDLSYYKIPLEVAYRYPTLFTLRELESDSNSIIIEHGAPQMLEKLRFAWWTLYEKQNVDRDQVIRLADKLASLASEDDRSATTQAVPPR